MATLSIDHVIFGKVDGHVDVVVRLSEAATQTVTVDYATQADALSDRSSHIPASGTLVFVPGEAATQVVRVPAAPNADVGG